MKLPGDPTLNVAAPGLVIDGGSSIVSVNGTIEFGMVPLLAVTSKV